MKCLIGQVIDNKGIKRKYIAIKLGVSEQQLSNWVRGRNFPPLDKAIKLAKVLDCKVEDLFELEEE